MLSNLPELLLAGTAALFLCASIIAPGRSTDNAVFGLAMAILLAVFGLVLAGWYSSKPDESGGRTLSVALFIQLTSLIAAIVTIFLIAGYAKTERFKSSGCAVVVLFCVLGCFLIVRQGHSLLLWIGVETITVATLALIREGTRTRDDGEQFFRQFTMLAVTASSVFAVGFMLAGNNGDAVAGADLDVTNLGVLLIFMGLGFKFAAVPFHFWAGPHVRTISGPRVLILCVFPPIGAFAAISTLLPAFADTSSLTFTFVAFSACCASILWGGLSIFLATSLKAVLAGFTTYSSGFVLAPLALFNLQGFSTAVLSMSIFVLTVLGLFAVLLSMRREDIGTVEEIADLAGLSTHNPSGAFWLTSLLVCLASLPPTIGFFGRWDQLIAFTSLEQLAFVVAATIGWMLMAFRVLIFIREIWTGGSFARLSPPAKELSIVWSLCGFLVLAGAFQSSRLAEVATRFAEAAYR
ncbi:MAG: proton-conducting transporter membrane subunit [Pseudomonadota bacterium]